MASYKVKWGYKSSIGGPWMKGDVVQVDEPLAEAINKDSPGVLVAVVDRQREHEDAVDPSKKQKDRMVKESENRVKEPLLAEDPITKADFKAVKK